MKIALVGQPNSGKSTIFNWVAGYKSATANFPGTTVTYTGSKVRLNGLVAEIVDLPGIYSLAAADAAAEAALDFLIRREVDVIVNVIDASRLIRGLELTLQLIELGRPVVVCLNMMDEAARTGVHIDLEKLSGCLGVPVVATVAAKGDGVSRAFQKVREVVHNKIVPAEIPVSAPIARALFALANHCNGAAVKLPDRMPGLVVPNRLLFLKVLENNAAFVEVARRHAPDVLLEAPRQRAEIENIFGRSAPEVISGERHANALRIFEQVATIGKPYLGWRDKIDRLLMHKFGGYFFLGFILYACFNLIFTIGAWFEPCLLAVFEVGIAKLPAWFGGTSLLVSMLSGVVQGLGAGVAIVLPYLVPFLLAMAVLEDIGYLPRVAFLMDALMHRIGLHGTSVFPAILGYGCSVPAVMATRILRSPRDRLLAAALAIMVPCSARTTVILGLVAFYLGANAALAIYALNILVAAVAGKVLSKIWLEITPGLIMEIPPYRLPTLRMLLAKTWWRLKEFIVMAWPLLIIGSAALSLAEHWQLDQAINHLLRPITALLDLPAATGTTLIFGVMRKELSLLMLMQAVGTTNIAAVMSSAQMMVFTLFVVFYIPCLATITVLWREIGKGRTLLMAALTLILAMVVGVLTRAAFGIIGAGF
ncbi:ferrous iron transport protein B [candidate division KSB1 bacterium]|nr:ferrous iron transport protein B [candidate division KSB1 bacterium]